MEIYELIQRDHKRIQTLLDNLVNATEHNEGTKRVLDDIENELIPHARAEEAIFYDSLREESKSGKGAVNESFSEHAQAETILRSLKGMSKIDVEWQDAAKKLKESLDSHIVKEESQMFSTAREVFSAEEATQLGEAFDRMKPEIRQQGSIKNTAEFIANLMPSRFSEKFRNALGR
jgi:hemerythrin-like domain-containing protein